MKRQRTNCEKAGIRYDLHEIGSKPQEEVLALVQKLAADRTVTGITVHQPMPKGFDENRVMASVPADKDIEATHPLNLGRVEQGAAGPQPVAARGAIEILRAHRPDCRGLHAVVVGRSAMVGKAAALMLLNFGAQAPTVTVCHSATKDLDAHTRQADIVIAAVGRPKLIKAVKPGAIVIDIGINRLPDKTLCGDVDVEAVKEVAGAITPVPGGVGPVALAIWLRNIVECARLCR
jgi:methylenetetrahydrofolate dehydrogenase (NADP+)/methenyltetrahydrofolate cyclohydrolase